MIIEIKFILFFIFLKNFLNFDSFYLKSIKILLKYLFFIFFQILFLYFASIIKSILNVDYNLLSYKKQSIDNFYLSCLNIVKFI